MLLREFDFRLCRTEYHFPPDENSGGDRSANGTWSGVLGMFQRKEVSITNVPLTMVSMRMDVADFSFPTLEIR
jgi:hypothetical protein